MFCMKIRDLWLPALTTALAVLWLASLSCAALAQDRAEIVPDAWRGDVAPTKPDFNGLKRLRFVTGTDYPPFQYYDEEGVLTGFNIDLAKAICEVLDVKCDIRQVDWDDLFKQLQDGSADAAIASLRISPETLKQADFTNRYYTTPARFVARKGSPIRHISPESLKGVSIAVVRNTGHEAYLKTYFADAKIVPFDTPEAAREALKAGKTDLAFGDGIGLTFWLNGVSSDGCCEFRGGPYLDAKYFGEGVGIAVAKGHRHMIDVLDYGLQQVHATGRYEELFLRYFPMNFF
jgi:polar amino acid transport system substrate-binding protein